MPKSSLARRLAFGFGGSFAILTLMSGSLLYWMLAQQLRSQRNLILQDRLGAISTLLKSPSDGYSELKNRIEKQWPVRGGETVFIQIIDGWGQTVFESPLSKTPDPFVPNSNNKVFLLQSETFNVNSIGLPSPVQVHIAIGNEQSLEFLSILRDVLIAVFLFIVILSLFVGWQVVRKELRPLQMIVRKVGKIDSYNLRERIQIEGLPIELYLLGDAFNRALDRLSDSFARLSQFSSDIAHELRTPASNIQGSIEVALSRPRSIAEYCNLLESNLEECDRITRITESLLFLARAENLQGQLTLKPMSLKNEIESMIEFYEPLASEKSIRIIFQNQASEDLHLMAENTLFQRVLSNLISNAIRYTPDKGQIEIKFQKESETWVQITVSDSGSGIPASELSRIFERFYRVDASRSVNSGGSGLGLAIVKSIVELHGGQISVQSQLGIGSEFSIRWPMIKPLSKGLDH